MKKNSNMEYIFKNFDIGGNNVEWLISIENFFGKEQAEEFCDYFINYRHILRKNDIRNLIKNHSLSVYKCSDKEKMAFLSIYKPIKTNHILFKNTVKGFETAQKFYRKKSIELSEKIKKLGYSYSTTWANWKDKTKHDTYQKEYIFVVYSEQDTPEQFEKKILKLANEYNLKSVLITDNLVNDTPKLKITSKLYDTKTENILQRYEDTTIEVVEKYLSDLTDTKVLFKIPYENNKEILCYDEMIIPDYYSKDKQEKVKQIKTTRAYHGNVKTKFSKKI